jgi:putative transposase
VGATRRSIRHCWRTATPSPCVRQLKCLIRDRDGKYPALFDAILADAAITVVLSGVRMPRMNSIMGRWIQSCRHELLDRMLLWNQAHLLHALREYERHHNRHRPHRGIANARPPYPLPEPITDPETITRLHIRRHDRVAGLLHEYEHAA